MAVSANGLKRILSRDKERGVISTVNDIVSPVNLKATPLTGEA